MRSLFFLFILLSFYLSAASSSQNAALPAYTIELYNPGKDSDNINATHPITPEEAQSTLGFDGQPMRVLKDQRGQIIGIIFNLRPDQTNYKKAQLLFQRAVGAGGRMAMADDLSQEYEVFIKTSFDTLEKQYGNGPSVHEKVADILHTLRHNQNFNSKNNPFLRATHCLRTCNIEQMCTQNCALACQQLEKSTVMPGVASCLKKKIARKKLSSKGKIKQQIQNANKAATNLKEAIRPT